MKEILVTIAMNALLFKFEQKDTLKNCRKAKFEQLRRTQQAV